MEHKRKPEALTLRKLVQLIAGIETMDALHEVVDLTQYSYRHDTITCMEESYLLVILGWMRIAIEQLDREGK